nr:hypothetical protein [Saprospira grandis]
MQGSQVCSALQASLRFAFGLAFGHPFTALGRSTVFFALGAFLRRLIERAGYMCILSKNKGCSF